MKKREKKIRELETQLSLSLMTHNQTMNDEMSTKQSRRITYHSASEGLNPAKERRFASTDHVSNTNNPTINGHDNSSNSSGSSSNIKHCGSVRGGSVRGGSVRGGSVRSFRPGTSGSTSTFMSKNGKTLGKMDILRPDFQTMSLRDRSRSPAKRSVAMSRSISEQNGDKSDQYKRSQSAQERGKDKVSSSTCNVM